MVIGLTGLLASAGSIGCILHIGCGLAVQAVAFLVVVGMASRAVLIPLALPQTILAVVLVIQEVLVSLKASHPGQVWTTVVAVLMPGKRKLSGSLFSSFFLPNSAITNL
jgi:hypothetical protein